MQDGSYTGNIQDIIRCYTKMSRTNGMPNNKITRSPITDLERTSTMCTLAYLNVERVTSV